MKTFWVQIDWKKPSGLTYEKSLVLPARFDVHYPGCIGITGNGWIFRTRESAEQFRSDVYATYSQDPTYLAGDDGIALQPNLTIRELEPGVTAAA